ncbi:MAG: uncharacterized membrane protein YebE (DUF533 family) [Patiriisocius sp.]
MSITHVWSKSLKNLNSIISRLSGTGLLSGMASTTPKVTSNNVLASRVDGQVGHKPTKSPSQNGALAAIGGTAWKAYQAYSKHAYAKKLYPRSLRMHQAYAQQSHLQNIYLQRRLLQQVDAQKVEAANQHQSAASKPAAVKQSRYIPSSGEQTLTYSPSWLSQQQFEQVIHDDNHESGQMLMLRAMISAANADGHIDENERQRIYQQVDNFDLSSKDKACLFDELRSPLSLSDLVNAVPNSQTAIEVYAASVLAIDEKQAGTQEYLNKLAFCLSIPAELVNAVHDQAQQIIYE